MNESLLSVDEKRPFSYGAAWIHLLFPSVIVGRYNFFWSKMINKYNLFWNAWCYNHRNVEASLTEYKLCELTRVVAVLANLRIGVACLADASICHLFVTAWWDFSSLKWNCLCTDHCMSNFFFLLNYLNTKHQLY